MDINLQALIMGIVQGLTEPLPVSSSGHLLLVPYFFGWQTSVLGADGLLHPSFIASLEFSVILHMGTLIAVLAYFWRDWARLIPAGLAALRDRSFAGEPDRKLALLILVTLPPAALLGFFLNDFFEQAVRRPVLVAVTLVIGAGILWLADRLGRQDREAEELGFLGAFGVGCAQALALVPGISRSGISMSAGLTLGLTREAAARFSFLMSAPIIAGAGVFELKKVVGGGGTPGLQVSALGIGFLASLITGIAAIHVLLRFVRTHSLNVFVVYRLILAAIVVVLFFNA